MKVFAICPVRNADPELTAAIGKEIADLEAAGYEVHWPPRDTPQDDPIGTSICACNRDALLAADFVAVWYDPTSQGSLFDLGIAWGAGKRVVLLNEVTPTECKSFANVLLNWNNAAQPPLFTEAGA